MWNIGLQTYHENFIEYFTWAARGGYPQAPIQTVEASRKLLENLAALDSAGNSFREHIVRKATTFIGDGKTFINGVGKVGELAYQVEANLANFSCIGSSSKTCDLLAIQFNSSYKNCLRVQSFYDSCMFQIFRGNKWTTNCQLFETSLSNPTDGIQCGVKQVQGKAHPFIRKRGNILYEMLYASTFRLVITDGLWCRNILSCSFDWGGLFITQSVKNLFFNGFTDPTVLKYLNIKMRTNGRKVSFECVDQPYGQCGKQNFHCNDAGVNLLLPNGKKVLWKYGSLAKDRYFAPHIEVTAQSELLWPYSPIQKEVDRATAVRKDWRIWKEELFNPFWAAYPAWNSKDKAFQKYVSCQKRLLSGIPNQFSSCYSTVTTGRTAHMSTQNIETFLGNSSILYLKSSNVSLAVNGSISMQAPYYMWDGFSSYPFTFQGETAGPKFGELPNIVLFHKELGLSFSWSQTALDNFLRTLPLGFPIIDGPPNMLKSKTVLRRYKF